jgi:hypothetical protein
MDQYEVLLFSVTQTSMVLTRDLAQLFAVINIQVVQNSRATSLPKVDKNCKHSSK